MSNADPTFKSEGGLIIGFINDGCAYYVDCVKGSITWPHTPQHPWVEGKDYRLKAWDKVNQKRVREGYMRAFVDERGPAKVAKDDIYQYEVEPMKDFFRFRIDIVGVEGGSVLHPFVAHYDLSSLTPKWKWFHPERFTGEWGIHVQNRWFILPVGLSVIYDAGEPAGTGGRCSTILFRMEDVYFRVMAGEDTPFMDARNIGSLAGQQKT